MRVAIVVAVACLSAVGLCAGQDVQASIKKSTNIPAQELVPALKTLANQRGFQLVFLAKVVGAKRTQGAVGDLTTAEALTRLLEGTNLVYSYLDDKTVTIFPVNSNNKLEQQGQQGPAEGNLHRCSGNSSNKLDYATSLNQTASGSTAIGWTTSEEVSDCAESYSQQNQVLAAAIAGADATPVRNSDGDSGSNRDSTGAVPLQEVIVTAQKRSERLQDVPMAVTALRGEDLVRRQSYRFEDYVQTVPGLTLIEDGPIQNQLVIRGLAMGDSTVNSSVAVYVDETPFTPEGPFAGSTAVAPNLDTFDMNRIEVLKGPQGTLYGSNALGGLLKFVTNAPDPSGFAATAESGVSSVYNGGVGFDLHAMVNMPVSSDAALRVVGYDNYYPGFIDDPSLGLKGVNGSRIVGGRVSFLYEPTSDLSIRMTALYQKRSFSGWNTEDVVGNADGRDLQPMTGSLTQSREISQPGDATTEVYNATVNWDLGFAKFLSATSYVSNNLRDLVDDSGFFAPYFPGIGVSLVNNNRFHDVTEEARLASPDGRAVTWQLGVYYTDERAYEFQGLNAIDLTTHAIDYSYPVNIGEFLIPTTYREYAGFASVDWHIMPMFDVEAGGRYSHNTQTFHETGLGEFGAGTNIGQNSQEGVFTWSFDARWHVTPEYMLYARIATGFAPGGPNDALAPAAAICPPTCIPSSYKSSTTTNYEVGLKSSLFENHLTMEVSAFDIDWRDIQLSAIVGGFGTLLNGGTATSKGVEWAFTYVPVRGLTLGLNGAYTDAYLTSITPNAAATVGAVAGDRLPLAPLWAGSASAEYEQRLFGDYSGFAGLNWRFTGSRLTDFVASPPRIELPSNGIVDVRLGLATPKWTWAFYVKNVGNEIAINNVYPLSYAYGLGPQDASLYTPRTFGAQVTARF